MDRLRIYSAVERSPDSLQHSVQVLVEIGVPKPKDAIALCFQPGPPLPVIGSEIVASVVTSIEFDNKSSRQTGKVDHVSSDRNLSAEV